MPTRQKKLKILLVQPPNHNKVFPTYPSEPMGLETIAGPCALDHDIRIVDLRFERKPLESFLNEFKPDIVGVTGYSCDVENMRNILQRAKQYKKGIFNVVGGHHATAILNEIGIQIIGQFIIFQDFQEQGFLALDKFVIKHKVHLASYTIATPFPGTEFYKKEHDSILTKRFEYMDMYHSVLPTKLDGKTFFQQFYDLYKRTCALKRYTTHLLNRTLTIIGVRHEYRKDIPLFFLVIARLHLFIRRKAILNAYKLATYIEPGKNFIQTKSS